MEEVTCREYIEGWFPGRGVRVLGKIFRTTIWMGNGCATCGMSSEALAAFMVRETDTYGYEPFFCTIPVLEPGMLADFEDHPYECVEDMSMVENDWR